MRNGRTSRFVVLGWIIVMIASCSYGRDQAMPTRSPTANAQVTVERAATVSATVTAQPLTPTANPQTPQAFLSSPGTPTAAIGGKLCYPSERIAPMIVYARNVDTGVTYMTQVERGELEYTITVPAPANYILFAWTTGDPFSSSRPFTTSDSFGGIYSCAGDFLGQTGWYPKTSPHWKTAQWKCYGLNTPVPLEDHTPIVVQVRPGERISDAFICDFYADRSAVPRP